MYVKVTGVTYNFDVGLNPIDMDFNGKNISSINFTSTRKEYKTVKSLYGKKTIFIKFKSENRIFNKLSLLLILIVVILSWVVYTVDK